MTSARDRDGEGRPRNARPRDGLGRLLPRDAAGAEPYPDPVFVSAEQTLDTAQHLLTTRHPFQAHEVFEAAWKSDSAENRDLWQGLAQLAVGITHAARGNSTGAIALLTRGDEHLDRARHVPPYVDVAGIRQWVRESTTALRSAAGPVDLAVPTLRVSELVGWRRQRVRGIFRRKHTGAQ